MSLFDQGADFVQKESKKAKDTVEKVADAVEDGVNEVVDAGGDAYEDAKDTFDDATGGTATDPFENDTSDPQADPFESVSDPFVSVEVDGDGVSGSAGVGDTSLGIGAQIDTDSSDGSHGVSADGSLGVGDTEVLGGGAHATGTNSAEDEIFTTTTTLGAEAKTDAAGGHNAGGTVGTQVATGDGGTSSSLVGGAEVDDTTVGEGSARIGTRTTMDENGNIQSGPEAGIGARTDLAGGHEAGIDASAKNVINPGERDVGVEVGGKATVDDATVVDAEVRVDHRNDGMEDIGPGLRAKTSTDLAGGHGAEAEVRVHENPFTESGVGVSGHARADDLEVEAKATTKDVGAETNTDELVRDAGEREVGKIREDAGSAVEDGKAALDDAHDVHDAAIDGARGVAGEAGVPADVTDPLADQLKADGDGLRDVGHDQVDDARALIEDPTRTPEVAAERFDDVRERNVERVDEAVEFGKGAAAGGEREVGKIREDAGSAVEDGKAALNDAHDVHDAAIDGARGVAGEAGVPADVTDPLADQLKADGDGLRDVGHDQVDDARALIEDPTRTPEVAAERFDDVRERNVERVDEAVEFGKGAAAGGEREVGKIREDAGSAVEDAKAGLDETRDDSADRVDDAVGFGRGAVHDAVETGDGAVGGFGTGSTDRVPTQETSPAAETTFEEEPSGPDAVDIGRDPMADFEEPVDDAPDPFDRTHPDDTPVFEDKTGMEEAVDESTSDPDIDLG